MTRTALRWWILATALVVLGSAACTSGNLDDSGSANVVLEVTQLTNPPVTGQRQNGTCSITTTRECFQDTDCPINEACDLPINPGECVITAWSATLLNVPKNSLANVSPFNDVVVEDVVISYEWIDGVTTTPDRTRPAGIVIPANGTSTVTFFPISPADLAAGNTSVNLAMRINGRTLDGTALSSAVGSLLFIEDCVP